MSKLIKAAYVRLLSTQEQLLEPWKEAFQNSPRFQETPNNPVKYLYPEMIDLAYDYKQLDVENVLDQLESCSLAWVQAHTATRSQARESDPQEQQEDPSPQSPNSGTVSQTVTIQECYDFLISEFKAIEG